MSKLINCKDCGSVISKNADACPNCGAKVKRTSILTWIAVAFIGIMILSAVMAGMSDETTNDANNGSASSVNQAVAQTSADTTSEVTVPEAPTSKWQYNESIDEMRGKSSYFAINKSTNTATLDFPYGQGVELGIVIREDAEHGKDILFAVNKGQLFCTYQDCYVSVKFDDGPVERIATTEAAAGSSEVLFLEGDISGFVNKLKGSDQVMIEVNFFDHGNEQFKFDVAGLEWSRF